MGSLQSKDWPPGTGSERPEHQDRHLRAARELYDKCVDKDAGPFLELFQHFHDVVINTPWEPNWGHLTGVNAHWQYDASSIVAGTLKGSSIIEDNNDSNINDLSVHELENLLLNQEGYVQFVNMDNVCQHGADMKNLLLEYAWKNSYTKGLAAYQKQTPTSSPTSFPTETPTKSPSNSPTPAPSNSPTQAPSNSPSEAPSDSNSPSVSPSNTPTVMPTTSSPTTFEEWYWNWFGYTSAPSPAPTVQCETPPQGC